MGVKILGTLGPEELRLSLTTTNDLGLSLVVEKSTGSPVHADDVGGVDPGVFRSRITTNDLPG